MHPTDRSAEDVVLLPESPAAATNQGYVDREGRIVAEILERYRNMMLVATARITNRANTGQAAYNSMHMDIETRGLVRLPAFPLSLYRAYHFSSTTSPRVLPLKHGTGRQLTLLHLPTTR